MGSLDGLKILDFSTLLPGPYATLMLADMGAEVLKIGSASKPDIVTDYPPFIEGTDISASQAWLGRNKKAMFLNLKTKEGRDIVKDLVKEYDIVMEQFRPGVMDRLGLGYEDLKAVNPAVIYCSLTGYGQTGPLRDAAGHDINYMSRSGIISHAGREAEGPVTYEFPDCRHSRRLTELCNRNTGSCKLQKKYRQGSVYRCGYDGRLRTV